MSLNTAPQCRLSVVIITLNAADRLESCLASLGNLPDEIVILDGGSTDNTAAVAEHYNARLVTSTEWPGYGIQRQRAQAEARGTWILMIDSDERLSPGLRDEIRQAVEKDDPALAYTLPRLTWAFGRYIRHSGWWPNYVLRLYHRDRGHYDSALVHERVELEPGTRVQRLKQPLLHHTYRDLKDYLVKSAGYAAAWALQRHESGNRTSIGTGLVHGLACFLQMYIVRAGFLDGRAGFLLAVLSGHSTFVKYADLWLREHDPGPPGQEEP
jgi:(heptosyl)LPS beta-1,4-glucosyltransferase